MKVKGIVLFRVILSGLLLASLTACSSLASRLGEDSQAGEVYAGVKYARKNARNCTGSMAFAFPPSVLVTIPVGISDMILSAALDTVLVPLDYVLTNPDESKASLCRFDFK